MAAPLEFESYTAHAIRADQHLAFITSVEIDDDFLASLLRSFIDHLTYMPQHHPVPLNCILPIVESKPLVKKDRCLLFGLLESSNAENGLVLDWG